jgi:hypothetical protein
MVRQRIQISIVLLLCFASSGAQWDVVQTFAWGRMMANYSRAMPLAEAMAKTFDGEMCPLCRLVANARKQEQSRSGIPEVRNEAKILLFFQTVPKVIVEAPRSAAWIPGDGAAMTEGRSAPLLPPPRAASA